MRRYWQPFLKMSTREENYPTVNMEALACGTPVITFNSGGSPEIIDDTCGCVVACDDLDALEAKIKASFKDHLFSADACLAKARNFRDTDKFSQYISLYNIVLGNKL